MIITSLENEKVKKYKKLEKKKYRDSYNEFIVEGLHLIKEAYRAGILEELILEEGLEVPIDVPYNYYSKEIMQKLSTTDTPSSMLGLCKKLNNDKVIGNKILVLDNVQDPGNLGTIIRSSVAFNIDTIILTNDSVDLYNSKVLRSTQGMIFHINIVVMNDLELKKYLSDTKLVKYGTNVVNGYDASKLKADEKNNFILIVGNEGNGVRSELLDLCDKNLYIPMNKDCESLNVAIATSILLYELGK